MACTPANSTRLAKLWSILIEYNHFAVFMTPVKGTI